MKNALTLRKLKIVCKIATRLTQLCLLKLQKAKVQDQRIYSELYVLRSICHSRPLVYTNVRILFERFNNRK